MIGVQYTNTNQGYPITRDPWLILMQPTRLFQNPQSLIYKLRGKNVKCISISLFHNYFYCGNVVQSFQKAEQFLKFMNWKIQKL